MVTGLVIAALAVAPFADVPREAPGMQQTAVPAPISTDRPTESLSPGVVPRRSFQIESGWKYSRSRESGTRKDTHSLPDAVFRFGVGERFELRAGVMGWQFRALSSVDEPSVVSNESGFTDVSAGFKWAIANQRGRLPAVSLFVDINVPVGQRGFTDDYANPQVWVLFANNLSDKLALVYNVGPQFTTSKDAEVRRTDVDLEYVVTLSGAAAARLALFAEVFGSVPLSEGGTDAHTFQTGVSFRSSFNTQLDARFGLGLVENADDWLVGAGFSIRLPR